MLHKNYLHKYKKKKKKIDNIHLSNIIELCSNHINIIK